MTNKAKAQVKLYKLMAEWEFIDLKEKYPKVFELILTKLTEDEIQKERAYLDMKEQCEKLKEALEYYESFLSGHDHDYAEIASEAIKQYEEFKGERD